MKTDDARRYDRALVVALLYLEDTKAGPDVIDALKDLRADLGKIRQQGNPDWTRAHRNKIWDERVHRGKTQTVGEILALKAEQGEKAVLDALGVSRATFYRRLAKLRAYAEAEGIDANSVMYWSDEVR